MHKGLTWEGVWPFEKWKEGSQHGCVSEREMESEVREVGRGLTARPHGAKMRSLDYQKPLFKVY